MRRNKLRLSNNRPNPRRSPCGKQSLQFAGFPVHIIGTRAALGNKIYLPRRTVTSTPSYLDKTEEGEGNRKIAALRETRDNISKHRCHRVLGHHAYEMPPMFVRSIWAVLKDLTQSGSLPLARLFRDEPFALLPDNPSD